jgi:hypothetical protein
MLSADLGLVGKATAVEEVPVREEVLVRAAHRDEAQEALLGAQGTVLVAQGTMLGAQGIMLGAQETSLGAQETTLEAR